MSKTRLYKLAKELNVEINILAQYLVRTKAISRPTRNTSIDSDLYVLILREFGDKKMNKDLDAQIENRYQNINSNSKSNLITIGELFKSKIFRIPDYQRGFSWSEKELDALWKDLKDITGATMHFTGIISLEPIDENTKSRIIKEKEVNEESFNEDLDLVIGNNLYTPFFIVDGQQRLTSLMILLTVLKESFQDSVELTDNIQIIERFIRIENSNIFRFGYEKDTPSHQFLLNKIFNDESIEITEPETIYTKNLIKAKDYFKEKISTKDSDDEAFKGLNTIQKLDLFNKIQNNLLFNILILDNKQVDISMVFETLNYRGKPLSKLEILKNRLMFLTSKKFKESETKVLFYREKITQTWLKLYEWLGKGKSNINQIDDDSFLRAFWIMYFKHDDRKETRFGEFETDLFDNKFRINETSKNILLEEYQLNRFLETLIIAVKAWHYIIHPDDHNQSKCIYVNKQFTYYLKLLNKISQGKYVQPMLMALMCRRFDEVDEENNLIKVNVIREIEKLNVILFFINGKSADTNRAQSWRFANKIFAARKGKNLNKVESAISESGIYDFISSSLRANTKKGNFKNHIYSNRAKSEQFWDWNGRDYLLLQYEWELRGTSIEDRDLEIKYKTYRLNSDEHILKYDNNFFVGLERSSRESTSIIQNSIGNIFIGLHQNKNFKDSGLEFENEKIHLLNDIGEKINEWTFNNILNRGEHFLNFICNHYGLSFGNEQEIKGIILQRVIDTSK